MSEIAKDPSLSTEEAKVCGMGTENACFAITMGADGLQCALISNPNLAAIAGMKLGWRVNVDPSDGKACCPKGVLDNSKVLLPIRPSEPTA